MIPGDLDYRYDRRVDPEFLDLLTRREMLNTVTEYARKARFPIDLQFRRHVPSGAQHASLYIGLSTVLDIHWRPGHIRLDAHATYRAKAPFDPRWPDWTPIDDAKAWMPGIETYLDTIIPIAAAGRAAVEGAVQAAVSSFGSTRRVMLDREVMLHFRDVATKKRIMKEVTEDLLEAIQDAPVPGPRPASFGGKCDLLSIDAQGQLEAVEVKPRGVSSIVWAPAQAIVYARLLDRWLEHDPEASDILAGMLAQRQQLKLVGSRIPSLAQRPTAIPVLAVQRGMAAKHREGLFAVQSHLADHGFREANALRVYEVTLAGRLIPASEAQSKYPAEDRPEEQGDLEIWLGPDGVPLVQSTRPR